MEREALCAWWLGVGRFLTWLCGEGKDDEDYVLGLFWYFFLMQSVCEKRFDATSREVCADDLEEYFVCFFLAC